MTETFKEWWDKRTKAEKRILAMVLLMMDALDYGMKNPESDIGKLMRLGW